MFYKLFNRFFTSQIKDIVEIFHKDLSKENMANISSAQAYITAVRAARQATKEELQDVLDDVKNKNLR